MSGAGPTIFSSVAFTQDHWNRLREVAPDAVVRELPTTDDPRLEEMVADAEIAFIEGYHHVDPAEAPHLRWVQTASAGVDALLGTPLWSSDIPIANASGIQVRSMAEWAFSCILSLQHRLPYLRERQKEHVWASRDPLGHSLGDLADLTLGVIGYGSIGREVGRLGKAFGMRLLATMIGPENPRDTGYIMPGAGDPEGVLPDVLGGPEYQQELLAQSDVVVLTIPSTPSTRRLIGEDQFRAMKESALFVNMSRGTVVDEAALIEALRQEEIGAAALDVTEIEPLPGDSPLWDMENVLVCPHVAWYSPAYYDRLMDLFRENVRRDLAGLPLVNVVHRKQAF